LERNVPILFSESQARPANLKAVFPPLSCRKSFAAVATDQTCKSAGVMLFAMRMRDDEGRQNGPRGVHDFDAEAHAEGGSWVAESSPVL
jgi:hypothetical protein